MQLLPHNYAEIAAALVCLGCVLYKPSVINRWFIFFLWLTVIVELTAKQLQNSPELKNEMYNVFNIVEFVFYLLLLATSIEKPEKSIFRWFAMGFTLVGIINLFFGQQRKDYNHYTTMLGSILIIIACLILYRKVLVSSLPVRISYPILIISFGLLIFYSGNFIVYSFYSSLLEKNPKLLVKLYGIINGYLNVWMYFCFALAFVIEAIAKPLEPLEPA